MKNINEIIKENRFLFGIIILIIMFFSFEFFNKVDLAIRFSTSIINPELYKTILKIELGDNPENYIILKHIYQYFILLLLVIWIHSDMKSNLNKTFLKILTLLLLLTLVGMFLNYLSIIGIINLDWIIELRIPYYDLVRSLLFPFLLAMLLYGLADKLMKSSKSKKP